LIDQVLALCCSLYMMLLLPKAQAFIKFSELPSTRLSKIRPENVAHDLGSTKASLVYGDHIQSVAVPAGPEWLIDAIGGIT
jgi:hypothetical protein